MTVATQPKPVLLKRVIATLGELPVSHAGVVSTVMRMTADINTEINKLSQVLSADQALTARVLRMSNSPFYGRTRGVGSLNEAIMILGFYTIRSLVVATSTHAMFKRDNDSQLERDLWRHSLAVGLGARIVARRINSRNAEESFLAGLMHDIAILILLQRFPEEYSPVINEIQRSGMTLRDAEEEILGFTHTELGAIILDHWNLPKSLVEVTRYHHRPDAMLTELATTVGIKDVAITAHIVSLADELAKAAGCGFHETRQLDLTDHPSVKALGLRPDTIGQITEELTTRFSEELKLFEE